jgi:diaminopimelate decarboxylase
MEARVYRALIDAAERFGTPVYLTDLAAIRGRAEEVADAFPDPWIRQFSVKANDVPAIIKEVAACGFGANVVSRGEWALASEARVSNEHITLEGIGKSDEDLAAAVQAVRTGAPLRWISLESVEESGGLADLASKAGLSAEQRLDVLLRINPQVEPETLSDLAVGAASSKFGMDTAEIGAAIEAGGGINGPLRWRGLHLHVGSQLRAVDAWRSAVSAALKVFAELREGLSDLTTLDVGGGFPAGVQEPPRPGDFARAFADSLEGVPAEARPQVRAIEPGRFITAEAGYLVGRVLHVRDGRSPGGEPLVLIDTGMTELIRPALYGAIHPVVALTAGGKPVEEASAEQRETLVEGPVCESTDRFGRHALPALKRNDLVAILDAGAYASSMSSRYNGRPRPAEVLLEPDGRLRLGRPRGHAGLWQRA